MRIMRFTFYLVGGAFVGWTLGRVLQIGSAIHEGANFAKYAEPIRAVLILLGILAGVFLYFINEKRT